MFTMKRLTLAASAAAIALILAPAPHDAAAQETLKIGTEGAYPPFNNLNAEGKLEGFDVDIANALCAEMKVTCEFVTQEWDGIIPALQAGKFDAIVASMSITDERKKQVDFTVKYYQTPPALIVPKNSTIADLSPASLADKTIGVQSSTTHAIYAETTYKDSEIKLYPSTDEQELDIVNGRIDASMGDMALMEGFLAKPEGAACCKMLGAIKPVPEIHGEGVGVAVRKGETELVERFNAAIDAIRANGTYKKINDKYFKYDVYGG